MSNSTDVSSSADVGDSTKTTPESIFTSISSTEQNYGETEVSSNE